MPMNRQNQRYFYRKLYAGWDETCRIIKRGNDQQAGQTQTLIAFECRRKKIHHAGEPLKGTTGAGDRSVWQIPRTEMDRLGITEFNPLDMFVGEDSQTWQAEANDGEVTIQLGKDYCNVYCRRVPGTGS